ncbi:MAG TPA: preprotein translocase subunit YajC [Acidimicrobiales bacterium]|nr:preprotein translocase subunit YajC [Acidimicrobiales bacterium]
MEGAGGPRFSSLGWAHLYMHLTNSFLFLSASTTTTTSSSSSSSSSSLFLIVIIALVAAFYFLMIRPNQRRRMQAMRQSRAFDIGDEVVAGGMVGRVVRIGDGEVDVEVADGVNITFVPNAVQSRAAYNAGPAARGMGGGGFGARPMGSTGPMSSSRPGSASRPASDSWPDADDGPELDDGANGSGAGAENGSLEDGGAGDVTAGGDGGVEPSGEEH